MIASTDMSIKEDRFFQKYPYSGAFFTWDTPMDAPLDQREPQEILVEEVEHCDIQRQSARHQGFLLGAGYTVYYPLTPNPEWDGKSGSEQYLPIKVRRGMTFKGGDPLYLVTGEVEFVRFSQLGEASIDIKVNTETDN